MHKITIKGAVSLPEEGLLLGNGDLSASVWQKPGAIVFSLGKGDFWDRRIDLSKNPKPAHIGELRSAVERGKIACNGVTQKSDVSIADQRLAELCRPLPSQRTPTPCPKPGVELLLHYPEDLRGLRLRQALEIENGIVRVSCKWNDGVRLEVFAVVHPKDNRLSVKWELSGWNRLTRYGGAAFYGVPDSPPVYASLWRESDPALDEFRRVRYLDMRFDMFAEKDGTVFPPLPRPEILDGAPPVLKQCNPGGNSLYASLRGVDCTLEHKYGVIHAVPPCDATLGELSVSVSTDSLEDLSGGCFAKDSHEARRAARAFWSRSGVSLGEGEWERLWYASLHAKRCLLKAGKIPPGLFMPSTLPPYSLWNGDYHLNYNYQSNFLGDFEANHLDTGDAFFTGLEPLLKLGRKIARDYYGSAGCFVQLSGFPFELEDDHFGVLPLGRMAYMTGWVAAWYYRRWRLSMDRDWLKSRGYPALRDFALFYAGFLRPDEQGVWHAFPSNQGENDFSREKTLDQPQVAWHARYCLNCAAEAAEFLQVDAEAAGHWRHIARNLAVPYPADEALPAEFAGFDGRRTTDEVPDFLDPENRFYAWYSGQTPYRMMTLLRQRRWNERRDYEMLKRAISRWILPNGLMRAMAHSTHGFCGGWMETLGMVGVFNDMLMQSWSGVIELFPGWNRNLDAEFTSLRADGAFLVSARLRDRIVTEFSVYSEKGGTCKVANPWKKGQVMTFACNPGETRKFLPPDTAG